jgi:hypothetical protein
MAAPRDDLSTVFLAASGPATYTFSPLDSSDETSDRR